MSQNTWQQFFDTHAPKYEENSFTKNTRAEIMFLLEELDLPQGSAILDMGCGTGRHAIELARAGYRVTGVDISPGMLAEARKHAKAAGVDVEWVQSDALQFKREAAFHAAISLCEGALCLVGPEDDPLTRDEIVIRNMSRALKPGGKLVITVLSASRMIRQVSEEDMHAGVFSLHTLTEPSQLEIDTPEGRQTIVVRERYHTVPELTGILQRCGIEVLQMWGGTAGAWNRQPLRPDEYEIMAVGRKAESCV